MRLAMKMPPKKRPTDGDFANGAHDTDPRENQSAEVIDLASRSVLPSVANKKSSDTMGMVAGIAIVAALGLVTLWSMNSARLWRSPSDRASSFGSPPPVRTIQSVSVAVFSAQARSRG